MTINSEESTGLTLSSIIKSLRDKEAFVTSVEGRLTYLSVLSQWITATNRLLYVEFSVPGVIEGSDITEMTLSVLKERLFTLDRLQNTLLQNLSVEKEERRQDVEQNTSSNP